MPMALWNLNDFSLVELKNFLEENIHFHKLFQNVYRIEIIKRNISLSSRCIFYTSALLANTIIEKTPSKINAAIRLSVSRRLKGRSKIPSPQA